MRILLCYSRYVYYLNNLFSRIFDSKIFFSFTATGVKSSALINSFLTGVNMTVILLVIVVGFYFGKFSNWSNHGEGQFLPYGFSGVISGAATCFYAYVGFDCIATSGEEAQEPAKSIPIATVFAMSIVSLGKEIS